jgi:hypothetical protein
MRRVHLRGRENILKRLVIHGAAFNLSLVMRKILGAGKPREFQSLKAQLLAIVWHVWQQLLAPVKALLSVLNALYRKVS